MRGGTYRVDRAFAGLIPSLSSHAAATTSIRQAAEASYQRSFQVRASAPRFGAPFGWPPRAALTDGVRPGRVQTCRAACSCVIRHPSTSPGVLPCSERAPWGPLNASCGSPCGPSQIRSNFTVPDARRHQSAMHLYGAKKTNRYTELPSVSRRPKNVSSGGTTFAGPPRDAIGALQ